jgi:hypothetical protein
VFTVTRMLPDGNIVNISSTCFGCLYTHHQEGRSCCVLLLMVCSGCSCDGSSEEGGEMCSLLRGCCLTATLPMVLCSGCSCDGSGEEGDEMCSLLRGCCRHPRNSEAVV